MKIAGQRSNLGPCRHVFAGELYDLTPFFDSHPGGKSWLALSAGTDCTALFETHHLRIELPRKRLRDFRVEENTPADAGKDCGQGIWGPSGFYSTLRSCAREVLCTGAQNAPRSAWEQAVGPTRSMVWARNSAVGLYFSAFAALCFTRSLVLAACVGCLTAVLGGFGHNALHHRGRRWD